MQDDSPFEGVLRAVEVRGLLRAPRRVVAPAEYGAIAGLEGEVTAAGRTFTLRLLLDASFPDTLPRFALQPSGALGVIPHVDDKGIVCFRDPEGLVLDRHRPVQVIEAALQLALSTLEDSITGDPCAEFADEFESYWSRLPGAVNVELMLELGDHVSLVPITFSDSSVSAPAAIASRRALSAYWNGRPPDTADARSTTRNALLLPLRSGARVVPPPPGGPIWSVPEARRMLLSGLTVDEKARALKLLKPRAKGAAPDCVIASLPRPSGGNCLFGIWYVGVGQPHPLVAGVAVRRMVPLRVQRRDRGYLVRRGGGDAGLGDERILLLGCGAVGAQIALELVRAGVLLLTLVDRDVVEPENTFRHLLGRNYWGQWKVEALKAVLEAQFPYVQITAAVGSAERLLADGSIQLSDYDVVVSALGNPTVELDVNERVHALPGRLPIIFTWVEPLGIGGHALLTHNGQGPGCLECLFTPPTPNSERTLANRAAFAAAGQSFGRALTGCGSLHTPYGAMDAAQTALLAARLAVAAMTGEEQANPLHSWKGESRAFSAAGFALSPRFDLTGEELRAQQYTYCSPRCLVCSLRVDRQRGDRRDAEDLVHGA